VNIMKDKKVRKVYKRILALLICPFILSGCDDYYSKCDIKEMHAHKYVGVPSQYFDARTPLSNFPVTTYLVDEQLENCFSYNVEVFGNSERYFYTNIFYKWQEESFELTEEDLEFYKVKKELFKGDENWDYLFEFMQKHPDYLEFHYHYDDGESTSDSWYSNRSYANADNVRVRHYKYFGYRIVKKDGKFVRERSPLVDDIRDIIDEYPYFCPDCYKSVYKEYKFKYSEIKNVKLQDIDEFPQPDLSNPSLKVR